ncbi:secretion system protein [Alicyclobacillus hesperidum subsp. aegles]|nr:secretion system protein [Alicyclobacillus hesperidum subsp. aegles]
MGVYQYEAMAVRGKRSQGRIEAEDEAAAVRQLSEQGLYVVELRPVDESIWTREINVDLGLFSGVKREQFVPFCRQFATLVRAGVPLVNALEVLHEQTEKGVLKSAIAQVGASVRDGRPLWESLAEYPRVFPALFVQMVRAGEASGTLDEVLENTAGYQERQRETVEKIRSAMIYPIVVAVMAVFVSIFLLLRVIPTFVTVFAAQHLQLPWPTRVVLGASSLVSHRWYIGLSVFVVLVAAVLFVNRHGPSLYWRDRLLLRVPVFGQLFEKRAMAQVSRTLAMLFHAALPALQAIALSADAVGNRYVARALRQVRDALGDGGSLSGALRETGAFSPMMVQMVRVGETTGQLDEMLGKVADFYESELAMFVDRLKQLMEPLLTALLAGVVGIIVLAALLPMFSLYQGMSSATGM